MELPATRPDGAAIQSVPHLVRSRWQKPFRGRILGRISSVAATRRPAKSSPSSAAHRNGLQQWHIDPVGKVLTTAGGDGLICRWDLASNREIPLAPGFRTAVKAVFSADGEFVVVGDQAGTVDVSPQRAQANGCDEVPRPQESCDWCTFALSPDGRTLAATRPDGTIHGGTSWPEAEIANFPDPRPDAGPGLQ